MSNVDISEYPGSRITNKKPWIWSSAYFFFIVAVIPALYNCFDIILNNQDNRSEDYLTWNFSQLELLLRTMIEYPFWKLKVQKIRLKVVVSFWNTTNKNNGIGLNKNKQNGYLCNIMKEFELYSLCYCVCLFQHIFCQKWQG